MLYALLVYVFLLEVEYLNGERWKGKGKEYSDNGILLFEGEYLNGERWKGKGIEYNENDKLLFEGEYLNGERKCQRKNYDDNFIKIILF